MTTPTSIVRRVTILAVLGLIVTACGGSDTTAEPAATSSTQQSSADSAPTEAVSGGPCDVADARLVIDGVEHICMLLTGKTLEWTPDDQTTRTTAGSEASGLASSDEIPAVMQNWGFDLQPYDPSSGMAGVMRIEGVTTPPFDPSNPMDSRYLFIDYGDPDTGTTDVQMAFFLPLDTPVISMVDGVVCDVPQLYSGDFSVRVAPTGIDCVKAARAAVMFETEHVINPLVKVGDGVVAGQQVATVSDYRKEWQALGFGVVEIGIAFNKVNDGSPWHACPARFLDPSKAAQLTTALLSIHTAWEAEIGDTTLYDEAAQSPLGCTTLDDFNE